MEVDVDADFAAWVGARERTLVRAAYLIRGDRHEAESLVVGVLASMAPRWDRLRSDDPDAEGRRLLYQDAIARHPHHRDLQDGGRDRIPDEWLGAGPDATLALHRLTPRQRAVLVLRALEDRSVRETADALGVGPGSVEAQTAAALHRVRQVVPWVDGLAAAGALLDAASGHLPDVDLADRAWDSASVRGQRRRRSLVGTTAVVVLLGSAATFATTRGSAGDAVPDRTSHVTSAPSTVPPSTALADDGTRLFLGPTSATIANLPITPVGVPGQVDWDPRAAPQPLAQIVATHVVAPGRASLRILYAALSPRSVDSWVPVLLLRDDRDGSLNYGAVPTTLGPLGSAFGDPAAPLTARAISADGTLALFLQPHSAVLVDVTTGATRRATLPGGADGESGALLDGGFTDSGQIVVRTTGAAWTLDRATLRWSRDPAGSGAEPIRVDTTGSTPRLLTTGPAGTAPAAVDIALPIRQTWGETVATPDWVATGGLVDHSAVPGGYRVDSALVLVSRSDPTVRRAVVFGANEPGAVPGGIRVVGVSGRVILFQYSVSGRTMVLGLDPTSGLVSRVLEAWSPVAGVGSASQVVAVSPWAISHPRPRR